MFQLFSDQRNNYGWKRLQQEMVQRFLIALLIALGVGKISRGELLDLRPVADTTLQQIVPANNMGGHTHVAIGTTAKNTAARGLFRWDVSELPTNAAVSAVTLEFTLPALNRADAGGSRYAIHRLLTVWGEGHKQGNLGTTATVGEASWQSSIAPTTWSAQGGGAGTDYVSEPSAIQLLGPAPGKYSIALTAALIADVQNWVARPEENFGWLLKVEDETVLQTARQFASRETTNAAILRIEYSVGPAPELRFTSIERIGTDVALRWTGGQGSITVESAAAIHGAWVSLGSGFHGAYTNAIQGEERFYRLRAD